MVCSYKSSPHDVIGYNQTILKFSINIMNLFELSGLFRRELRHYENTLVLVVCIQECERIMKKKLETSFGLWDMVGNA